MFVQIIQGRAKDAEAIRKQVDKWVQDVQPGAIGFLGSTGGVTDDGQLFFSARFESEEAAQKNSDRPEQGAWWEETSQFIENPTFDDYPNAELFRRGGSNDAGFVQAIQARCSNLDRFREVMAEFEQGPDDRPDLIGGIQCWKDDGTLTLVNYFTSEAEARKGESQQRSEEREKGFQEFTSLMEDTRWIDLKDPWYTGGE
ncbi:MAG: hypothetical protein M3280_03185 [Actinomycetota bacterium]|nr:hypothetical protein [Actinomycetota bacterium]